MQLKLTSADLSSIPCIQFYHNNLRDESRYYIRRQVTQFTTGVFMPGIGRKEKRMEPKTIIGICLVLFIVAGLAFLFIRNRRK